MTKKVVGSLTFLIILGIYSLGFAQTIAEWNTSMGMFRAEIREDLVPITGDNFIGLTESEFYDGLIFHRVVADFVIQDGCPDSTGSGGPGWTIPLEIHPDLTHVNGALGMARSSDPNSAGSQYYFCLGPQHGLDNNYAVFGKCVYGMDVVLAIGEVPVDANDRPLENVVIDSVRILGTVYPHIDLLETTITDNPEDSDGDGILNPLESGNIIVELKNIANFADGENTIGTLRCDDDRISIPDSIAEFGTLANGDSLSNGENPFVIEVLANEVFTTHLTLTVTANPEGDYPYEVEHDIPLWISMNQLGWPRPISNSQSSALIVDINNDGENELIYGDSSGDLHAVSMDGQSELPGFPFDALNSINSAVAVGNLDSDEELELVVGTFGNLLFVVEHDGSIVVNPYSANGQLRGNPMVADVNGDGAKEIIAVSLLGEIIVLNGDGTNYGNFPMEWAPGVLSSPAVADLEGDGNMEIIFVNSAAGGSIWAISTSDLNIHSWGISLGASSLNGPIVANIDDDEEPEVLVGLANSTVVVLDYEGTIIFTKDVGAPVNTSIVVEDLDGNGEMEIVFVNNNGLLFVTDNQGNNLFDFPVSVGAAVSSTPVLADLNGNGTVDIIFGDSAGYLHAFDVDGTVVEPYPLYLGGNLQISPVIGDIDGDGDVEIAIPNDSYYFVIDHKQGGEIFWPCFKGNPERTGNKADIYSKIPFTDYQTDTPKKTFLETNYPNPFNPNTSINFGIEQEDHVILSIYDISGKRIKTLINKNLEAGPHAITWNGTDDNGKSVSSGVYLYKMETANYNQTKRCLLLK